MTLDQQRALKKLFRSSRSTEGWCCGQRGQPRPPAPNNGAESHYSGFPSGHPLTSLRLVANFHCMYRKRGGHVEGGKERKKKTSGKSQGHEIRRRQPQSSFQWPFCSSLLSYPQPKLFLQPIWARFLQISVHRI